MPSKKSLAEQVKRRLSGGDPSVASRYDLREIQEAIMQALNSLLRPQFLQGLSLDESIPTASVLVTYDNIPVTAWNGVSKSTLPAIPIALPKNMGVFRISAYGDVFQNEFIPIPSGQFANVMAQRMLSDLLGQVGYEVRGATVLYTKDLTALSPAITHVSMQLVVSDFTQLGEFDLLPIPADMAFQVVDMVVKSFAPEAPQPQQQVIDSTSDTK